MLSREIVREAAGRYQTPFYIFDIDEAGREILRMKESFPERVFLCFSIKANPFLAKALGETADYLEACSFGELRICERAAVPEEKIVLSGVNKGEEDLKAALARHEDRILYTAESMYQWRVLEKFAEETGKKIRVMPRLTDGSQFGMDRSEIEEILAGKHGKAAEVSGIHFFSGTQKKNISRTLGELDMIDACLAGWKEQYGFTTERLEFGCGMAVDYFSEEGKMREKEKADLEAISAKLQSMKYQGEVTLEFGRRIAATCGTYVTSVADLKDRTDKDKVHHFAIMDGGIHQVSWYGQMMGMKTPPVFCLEKPGADAGQDSESSGSGDRGNDCLEYSVFGSLCSMNDVMLRSVSFPELETGDHLVFGRCGAYAPTEGMLTFLSRDLPQILTWSKKDGLKLQRKTMPTYTLNF